MIKHRWQERAFVRIRIVERKIFRVAVNTLGFCANDIRFFQNVALLAVGHQRPHAGPLGLWITNDRFGKARAERFDDRFNLGLRGEDTADGRTFLPGFCSHLSLHFFDEKIELRGAYHRIWPKYGGVKAVLFSHKADRVFQDMWRRTQLKGCLSRACKAYHILTVQTIQHVTQTTGHKLECGIW